MRLRKIPRSLILTAGAELHWLWPPEGMTRLMPLHTCAAKSCHPGDWSLLLWIEGGGETRSWWV